MFLLSLIRNAVATVAITFSNMTIFVPQKDNRYVKLCKISLDNLESENKCTLSYYENRSDSALNGGMLKIYMRGDEYNYFNLMCGEKYSMKLGRIFYNHFAKKIPYRERSVWNVVVNQINNNLRLLNNHFHLPVDTASNCLRSLFLSNDLWTYFYLTFCGRSSEFNYIPESGGNNSDAWRQDGCILCVPFQHPLDTQDLLIDETNLRMFPQTEQHKYDWLAYFVMANKDHILTAPPAVVPWQQHRVYIIGEHTDDVYKSIMETFGYPNLETTKRHVRISPSGLKVIWAPGYGDLTKNIKINFYGDKLHNPIVFAEEIELTIIPTKF